VVHLVRSVSSQTFFESTNPPKSVACVPSRSSRFSSAVTHLQSTSKTAPSISFNSKASERTSSLLRMSCTSYQQTSLAGELVCPSVEITDKVDVHCELRAD
jgi:hypothetical protein